MPLIKSHSNYVLKNKHQLINDGTIFERDITTIGAVNQFAPGQIPIYRSGNFIITVRDDRGGMNQYNTQKWEKGADGDSWTIATVDKMVSQDETQDDTKIVLKNDYYDFREFAYYGSLTELFRSSISDILTRFPGELYCVSGSEATSTSDEIGSVYYTSSYTVDNEALTESVRLGGSGYYEISNPYGINIHSATAPQDAEPLKYFANSGYTNYEIIIGDGDPIRITSWKSEYYYSEKIGKDNYIRYTASTDSSAVTSASSTTYYPCKGDKVAEIILNNDSTKKIYAYLGDDDVVYYLHTNQNDVHIRPKNKPFIMDFYNGCSDLQRIMLNPDTSPKYKAIFSVIKSNDFGYYRELQEFIYPTSEGGYNPSADGEYANRLAEIGEFYDEYLTDNLYRVMTHEAIKNFDWTYTREYNEGDEVEYVHGGEKIQKALRIFAREFDEQKKYIDNIKNTGKLSYDERGNIPDYFLADLCEDDGWDVKSVIPYDLTETWEVNGEIVEVPNEIYSSESGETYQIHNASGETVDGAFHPTKYFNREYSQSSNPVVTPYSINFIKDGSKDGYFIGSCTDTELSGITFSGCIDSWYGDDLNSPFKVTRNESGDVESVTVTPQIMINRNDGTSRIEYKIKSYTDETNTYTYMDVNNEFLRRLRLNSRQIWRHKGTLEGIEMILGMFGMKSKRWLCKNESCRYKYYKANTCGDQACNGAVPDYEIIEYTQFTTPIKDTWDDEHNMYKIDWINSTKTITYDYRSTSNYTLPGSMGAYYVPYQGLPVAYLDKSDGRYLYPKFDKNEQLDGNPYFQMDGGWLAKTISNVQNFQFDADDNIVHNPVVTGSVDSDGFVIDDHKLYKETVRAIKRLDTLSEMLSLPQSELYDGIICYVANVGNEIAVIDGEVFPVEYDGNKKFVRFTRNGGFIKVGDLYFDESIVVLNSSYAGEVYSIDDKLDGYEVKAYINGNSFTCKSAESGQYSITSFKLVNVGSESTDFSNYFKLDDVVFSDMITYETNGNGWRRLRKKDADYLKINTISNYYDGNNGHTGLMKYDSGHEYFTYFQRLFKYSEDNGLFDTRCYREGFNDLYNVLNPDDKPIGFSGLIHPNEAVTDYDTYISADTKVHYFGNYKKAKWCVGNKCDFKSTTEADIYRREHGIITPATSEIESINIYGTSDEYEKCKCPSLGITTKTCDPWRCFYGKTPNYYQITSAATSGVKIDNEIQPHYSPDPVTNQIVNNKRIKIKFNMKNKFNTKAGQIELKYIDDIVMNYLTQMIPSTVITEIEYNFCGFNNRECEEGTLSGCSCSALTINIVNSTLSVPYTGGRINI